MEAEERHKYANDNLNQQINKLKDQYGALEKQKDEEVANLKDTIEVRNSIFINIIFDLMLMNFS